MKKMIHILFFVLITFVVAAAGIYCLTKCTACSDNASPDEEDASGSFDQEEPKKSEPVKRRYTCLTRPAV